MITDAPFIALLASSSQPRLDPFVELLIAERVLAQTIQPKEEDP